MENQYTDLKEMTPETIADLLFSKMPDDPLTKQLLFDIPSDDENSGTFIYEILLTILLEGIMKFNNNLENTNLDDVQLDHIQALKPWFNSLRFNLKVEELNKNEENEEQYKYFYSKIILKKMPSYEMFFNINKLDKNYIFFLNPLYVREKYPFNNLNDIYSVIFLKDKIFKIKFILINEYK
jgi:hypothetical protein